MMNLNLADLFETVVDTVPDKLALVADQERLTFAELDQRANRLANHLIQQGLQHGDKVGIYAHNRAQWVESMLAASYPLAELAAAQTAFMEKKHVGNIVVTVTP